MNTRSLNLVYSFIYQYIHFLRLNFFLSSSLQNKIAQNRYWPLEIMRTPIQQATKTKGKQGSLEEDIPISFHGVAYVNMAPLLYPGVKRFVSSHSTSESLLKQVSSHEQGFSSLDKRVAYVCL